MNRHYKAILGKQKSQIFRIANGYSLNICPNRWPPPGLVVPQVTSHPAAAFPTFETGQLYGNPLSHLTRYKLSPAFSWCTSSYGQWIGDWLSLGFINSILYNHLQIRMSVFQYILMVWFLGILICHWISRWRNSSLVEFLIRSHWRKLESAAVGEFILLHQLGW